MDNSSRSRIILILLGFIGYMFSGKKSETTGRDEVNKKKLPKKAVNKEILEKFIPFLEGDFDMNTVKEKESAKFWNDFKAKLISSFVTSQENKQTEFISGSNNGEFTFEIRNENLIFFVTPYFSIFMETEKTGEVKDVQIRPVQKPAKSAEEATLKAAKEATLKIKDGCINIAFIGQDFKKTINEAREKSMADIKATLK